MNTPETINDINLSPRSWQSEPLSNGLENSSSDQSSSPRPIKKLKDRDMLSTSLRIAGILIILAGISACITLLILMMAYGNMATVGSIFVRSGLNFIPKALSAVIGLSVPKAGLLSAILETSILLGSGLCLFKSFSPVANLENPPQPGLSPC